MSATDHLSGYQFKYHLDPDEPEISAHYGDERVGHLAWSKGYPHPFDAINGAVSRVEVEPEHRRRGVATEMYRQARSVDPLVHHSPEQTEVGSEWASSSKVRAVDKSRPGVRLTD
jgi:hypothetical protein